MPFQEDVKQLKAKLDEQKKIFDAQDARAAEAKKAGQDEADQGKAAKPTADEVAQLKTLQTEIDELDARCSESREYEDMRTKNQSLRTSIAQPQGRPEFANTDPRSRSEEVKTAGEEFTQNPEFKEWIKRLSPDGGEISAQASLRSPVVNMKSLVMSVPTTAGGAFVRRDYGPWPVDLPLRPLTILDVITVLKTSSNQVEYVRVNSLTRAAKIVPEATSITDNNALKPEAGMDFEVVQTGVKNIAVLMYITRQILADVPQLESMITQFQRNDLGLALEEEVITGQGGANHFVGIENTPGLTPQAFVADALDSTGGMLTTTRKARTVTRVVGRSNPTGYLMNPYDWETIDLARGAQGQFYFGGPMQMGTKMLWGLPVIESEVIPQGTFYTGDLKQMVIWDRQQPTMYSTDSNRDLFERNIITILTEERAAFGVLRPAAIIKGDLHAGANS